MLFCWYGCWTPRNTTKFIFQPDGLYDTEFPNINSADYLEKAGNSIRLLNSIAYYKSYRFPADLKITLKEIDRNILRTKVEAVTYFNNTASGTATVIYSDNSRILFLTCAHIIDFPDTIVNYHDQGSGSPRYVLSLAVKETQANYVTDLPPGEDLKVLFLDKANDIAVLGRRFTVYQKDVIPVLPFKWGKARDLQWGTFVYLLGFPRGYKMVTHGIVSDPRRKGDGSFLVDAPFNRGFSGGIVLAIRDGVPNFELVGIAKSAAAEFQVYVKPPDNFDFSLYDQQSPYTGTLFLESRPSIQYGITNVVPIETVTKILNQHKKLLQQEGYDLTPLLK
jgi:hypothetical protein